MLSLSCHAGQQREVRLGPCVTRDHTVFNLPPTHGPQFVCSHSYYRLSNDLLCVEWYVKPY